MPALHTAYIGLGSNLDDPVEHVRSALNEFGEVSGIRLVKSSPLYQSSPLGPQDQPNYVNAVAMLETRLSPEDLLQSLQTIEASHGRVRTGERWGPRTLDLDVLLYDALVQDDPHLTIPHPGLHERSFVLYPLFDVAPDLLIPNHGKLEKLLEQCPAAGLERLAE